MLLFELEISSWTGEKRGLGRTLWYSMLRHSRSPRAGNSCCLSLCILRLWSDLGVDRGLPFRCHVNQGRVDFKNQAIS